MKKIICLFICVIILLFSVSCTAPKNNKNELTSMNSSTNLSAEDTVKSALDALIKLDVKKFNEHINYKNTEIKGGMIFKDNVLFSDDIDGEDKSFIKGFVSNLSYEIVKSKMKENEASVKIKITNRDFSNLLKHLISESVSDEECENKLLQLMNGTTNNKTFEVTLSLYKNSNQWKINMNTDLFNAITGGMLSDLG